MSCLLADEPCDRDGCDYCRRKEAEEEARNLCAKLAAADAAVCEWMKEAVDKTALADRLAAVLDLELRCHFRCDICDECGDHSSKYGHTGTKYDYHAQYEPRHRADCPAAAALAEWEGCR